MKRVVMLFLSVLTVCQAQIQISTNLQHTIQLNRPMIFDIKINKGQIQNFSRYQMEVDPGVVVDEVDSKGGTFSFEENKVKIVWVSAPAETEFIIRMKLRPVARPLKASFKINYYYIENDEKKEFECQPHRVTFKDTVMPVLVSASMKALIPKNSSPKSARVESVNTKDPEKLKAQVAKLKNDSENAFRVGNLEHKKAEVKLATLGIDEKKVNMISDDAERKQLLEQVATERAAALEELQRAKKVLSLAKNLEAQANEIERINKVMNPESYGLPRDKKKSKTLSDVNAAKTVSNKKSKGSDEPPTAQAAHNQIAEPGPVEKKHSEYKVQIGAFQTPPTKNKYRYDNVEILREGNIYKLLVGSFQNKEDAYALRDSLSVKHKGCFVIHLKKGVRVIE